MSASIVARAQRVQQEQRALRHDLIRQLGRPQVFWSLLGLSAVLGLGLNALPAWISTVVVVALLAGMLVAGRSASERRSDPALITERHEPE